MPSVDLVDFLNQKYDVGLSTLRGLYLTTYSFWYTVSLIKYYVQSDMYILCIFGILHFSVYLMVFSPPKHAKNVES